MKRARRQVESLTIQNKELKTLLDNTKAVTARLIKVNEKPPEEEDLYNEINEIAEAYETLRTQNRKLNETVAVRDADLDRYITSKAQVIREHTRLTQEMNRAKEVNKRSEQALSRAGDALEKERSLVVALREELETEKEMITRNRLAHSRCQVELEETKHLLESVKRRAELAEREVETLREHSKRNEQERRKLETKVSRLKEDVHVLRKGGLVLLDGGEGNDEETSRKSPLYVLVFGRSK